METSGSGRTQQGAYIIDSVFNGDHALVNVELRKCPRTWSYREKQPVSKSDEQEKIEVH